jgi:hypothetical protein
MLTEVAPTAAMAPHAQQSVVRNAGLPPICTVALPKTKGLEVGWCVSGGRTHTWVSDATAAGIPSMLTVATPGPIMVPPWVVTSPTRAAGGISGLLFN